MDQKKRNEVAELIITQIEARLNVTFNSEVRHGMMFDIRLELLEVYHQGVNDGIDRMADGLKDNLKQKEQENVQQ